MCCKYTELARIQSATVASGLSLFPKPIDPLLNLCITVAAKQDPQSEMRGVIVDKKARDLEEGLEV